MRHKKKTTPALVPQSGISPAHAWLSGASLVLLVVIVYWPTLHNGFVSDDRGYVVYNPALWSLKGLYDLWFTLGTVQQYYPLVFSSFWVEYHLWGLEPRGYHVVNLLLHAAAVVLVWRVLLRLAIPGAWLAAAIFAVHPVEVESVAWVSERKNVLSCALALGSLLAYWQFSPPEGSSEASGRRSNTPDWPYYALSLALYVAALLSKSVTASVPAVLLVIGWWKQGRVARRDVFYLAPFFAVGLASAALTVWMEKNYVGAQGEKWDFTFFERLLIAGRAAWFYAGKLAWPDPLMFFYPRWTIDSRVWWQPLYPLAALALLIALWCAKKWIGRGPLAAALIFGGVLVPALGFFDVFPFRFSFVADHYQYHASIALIALAAAFGTLFFQRLTKLPRWVAPLTAAAVLVPLAVVAHQKTRVYKDDYTLHMDVAALDPNSWVAYNNLAGCLLNDKKYDEAIASLRSAILLIPDDPVPHGNLGWALSEMGRLDEANVELQQTLQRKVSTDERAWILRLLGTVQIKQDRLDLAMENLNQSIQLRPDWTALMERGRIQAIRGNASAALADLDEALRLQPQSVEVLELRAKLLTSAGKYDLALQDLLALRQARPDNPEILVQIAGVYQASNQWRQAVSNYSKVLESHPKNAAAYRGRADSNLALGQQREAVADYTKTIELEPNDVEALNNLAWILATSPNSPLRDAHRAVELAKRACEATQYKRADMISTLAASYAETGNFSEAVNWSRKALKISDSQLTGELTRQLESYQLNKPWREVLPPTK